MSAHLRVPLGLLYPVLACLLVLLGLLAACGGGDSDSSPTPTASEGGPTGGGTGADSANSLVVIGTPAEVNRILAAAAALDKVDMYLFTSLSQDPSAFDGVTFTGTDVVWGVQLLGPQEGTAAAFNAAYSEAYGDSPPGAPVWQAYDAVYTIALAAVAANARDGGAIRDNIAYVANSPGEVAAYGSDGFSAAVEALGGESGDVNYIGASGQVDFTADGNMSKGVVQTWKVLNGQIAAIELRDVDLAAEAGADVPTGEVRRAEGAPEGPLTIGVVVINDDIGTAISNAAELAVAEINAAGGVFGRDVVLTVETVTDTSEVSGAVGALAQAGAGAIIGPSAADAVAPALEAARAAGVPLFALSEAPALNLLDGEGYLFRAMPSLEMQMPVLANLALEADAGTFCVLFAQGDSGQVMADAFERAVAFKGATLHASEAFDPAAEDYTTILEACLG
jgi:ABC-type branched-subunit amino acid transport system substrate-binding protein